MGNVLKGKNQIAAENIMKAKYQTVSKLGDTWRRENTLDHLKNRMDALDAKKYALAHKLQNEIEKELGMSGTGKSVPLPAEKWWKTGSPEVEKIVDSTPPSSFGRRKRRSNVKRSNFGRKRRSSKKKRLEFGRKRRSSKRRVCKK